MTDRTVIAEDETRPGVLHRRTLLRAGLIGGGALALGGALPLVAAKGATEAMVWPITGQVTSLIGPRNGKIHEGIDIGAPVGRPVCAAAAGKVIASRSYSGYGNTVILDHSALSSLPMRWF